jgi:transcriptional regulator with XRE-family HTH domain
VTLSDQLRQFRNARRLTLRHVEHDTGISNAYLSQLENGRARNPSLDVLRRLADVYGITVETLVSPVVPVIPDSRRMTAGFAGPHLTEAEESRVSDFIQALLAEREHYLSNKR